jgi:hypothetical protein
MEMKKTSSGLGLGMILFIIFMVLKLTNNIDWSWWWVTSPLWIEMGLVLLIIMIGILVAFILKK